VNAEKAVRKAMESTGSPKIRKPKRMTEKIKN
jgi:hypothetical protein